MTLWAVQHTEPTRFFRNPLLFSPQRCLVFVVLFFSGMNAQVFAEGFRLPEQSASALGQANAFAAQADDPSALHYNPAGMTQLRRAQYSVGTNFVGGHISFISPTGSRVTGDLNGTIAIPPPSNFYLTANLTDFDINTFGPLTLGLGVTSPFGTLTSYPRNASFATAGFFAALPLIDIKPTAALKVNDYLSIGGGLDIYTFASFLGEGQAELQSLSGAELVPLGISEGSLIEVNGTDTTIGFNLGFLLTPLRNAEGKPRLNFAFLYRSQPTLSLEGEFLVNGARFADASTELGLPQIFTGAIAFWPVRNTQHEWKLEIDLDYADWSSFKNLDIQLSNGITLPQPRNWKGVLVVNVGTEYKWLSLANLPDWEIAFRGGYVRSETPIPEQTFEPTVPGSDYNGISIGLGFFCRGGGVFFGVVGCKSKSEGWFAMRGIGLDLAYQALLYQSRTISNNMNPVVNGTWDTTFHIGALNLRINF